MTLCTKYPLENISIFPLGRSTASALWALNLWCFLEVQVGEILDEDDIVRMSDDYGRLKPSAENSRKLAGSVL